MNGSTAPEIFLDRLVLISNSVPKSGSTFLYALQRDFLLRLAGKKAADFSLFSEAGVELSKGFVHKPLNGPFLDVLENETITGGPYILKTHLAILPRLKKLLIEKPNVFMSLAVRDPVEIFLSARDNYKKTGEFSEFSDIESGCQTILGYFNQILRTSEDTSQEKYLPIVRYEQIVSDPIDAMVASLHPMIAANVMKAIANEYTSIEKSTKFSSNRFNIGQTSRLDTEEDRDLVQQLKERLATVRAEFGY